MYIRIMEDCISNLQSKLFVNIKNAIFLCKWSKLQMVNLYAKNLKYSSVMLCLYSAIATTSYTAVFTSQNTNVGFRFNDNQELRL